MSSPTEPSATARWSIKPTLIALVTGLAVGVASGVILLGTGAIAVVALFGGVPGVLITGILVVALLGLVAWGLDWMISRRPGARARGFLSGAAAALAVAAAVALTLEATGGYPFGLERLPFLGGGAALGVSLALSRRVVPIVLGVVALILVGVELSRLWDLAAIPGNIPIPAGLGGS
jgi:hypothetical protein